MSASWNWRSITLNSAITCANRTVLDHERIGWSGDFYTSSDVHPILGRAIAAQARQMDELLGCPAPFTIVEVGAGKGLLARDCLAAIHADQDDFSSRVRYVLIERSPVMRELQRQNLALWLSTPGLVTWVDGLDATGPAERDRSVLQQ